MKVEVIKNEEQEITYPCIMKWIHSDLTVLFTGFKKGCVLVKSGDWQVGDYGDDWAMTQFIPFAGKLVLSNG